MALVTMGRLPAWVSSAETKRQLSDGFLEAWVMDMDVAERRAAKQALQRRGDMAERPRCVGGQRSCAGRKQVRP